MDTAIHACIQRYPGSALEISPDGVVQASNGRLELLVGREVVGTAMEEVIDSSSMAKWKRILSHSERVSPACTWELVLTTPRSLELRTFIAVWEGDDPDDVLLLLEYSVDPKLELLYSELAELHREVVESQRQLGRERARLAKALEKAEGAIRTRDEILAIVSHDLRNPLNTITMAAGMLEMPVTEEQKEEQLAIVRRTAEGMNRLIGDLLDASAVTSGRLGVDTEPLDLGAVLRETKQILQEQAERKHQQFEFRIEPDLPLIQGDRHRLHQVLSNLVGNAIKFTPVKGSITLRAEGVGSEVVVAVEDSGPGIDPEDLPHIFTRFWHASRARRGGAGLGLAIAKGIVEAHQGRIWVESVPGEGSVFSFALPRSA